MLTHSKIFREHLHLELPKVSVHEIAIVLSLLALRNSFRWCFICKSPKGWCETFPAICDPLLNLTSALPGPELLSVFPQELWSCFCLGNTFLLTWLKIHCLKRCCLLVSRHVHHSLWIVWATWTPWRFKFDLLAKFETK